jgi:anti-sigma regulatory factor (Ser/Thr protein kinase)
MFRVELQPEPESVAIARQVVSRVLDGAVGEDVRADTLLVVSELVTNSVRHGPGEPIALSLKIDDGVVYGEVADHGDGHVAIREISEDDENRCGGMGLRIVDQTCSDWGVYESSTHVWFEIGPST